MPDVPALLPPAPAPASASASAKPGGGFLGKDMPAFDPASEVLTWDGKSWNVNNQRIFQARFEKYLNAPEATTAEDKQYQAIIGEILTRLAPGSATTANIDYAFKLLPSAARFDIDARLCSSLADAVYSVWLAQRQQGRLTAANEALRFSRHSAYYRLATSNTGGSLEETKTTSTTTKSGSDTKVASDTMKSAAQQGRAAVELAELEGAIKANDARKALSEIQAKIEFQAVLVQFFMQRRFQHVLMATRFYRAIFTDGDSKLNLGKDAAELFQRSAGVPPTISLLDSLANEAIRDVREGVKAFDFLLQQNELESATKRLAEAFTVGEYLPEIRTLPRERKRQTLEFAQKSNQLISALQVKDYALAEKLVQELGRIARDFDNSKPLAAIETARVGAQLHLARARNAALSNDKATLEAELTAATEIWPRNPQLAEISGTIFSQGDVQQKALIDFDQLRSQRNFRQIYQDSPRFLAATAQYPERQTQLQEVLTAMQTIEAAIVQATALGQQANPAGAWESVERAAEQFPDDSKLNQLRASLTTQAAEFVRAVRSGQELEKREQVGSSLAWFLKAQKMYPASTFAAEGIARLVKKILPEGA